MIDTIQIAVDTVAAVDTVVTVVDPVVVDPTSPWWSEHLWEIGLAFFAFLKVVVNLVPSEKPREIFSLLDRVITALIPDRRK